MLWILFELLSYTCRYVVETASPDCLANLLEDSISSFRFKKTQ